MDQQSIFAPMGALALLTFAVLGLIPARRFRAASAQQVTADDFRFGESERVPGHVSIPNRNMMNLLELPALFYVAALMYYVAGRVTAPVLGVAWTYVALRAVHSAIHLTYNNVFHRLVVFAASNVVLGAFWVLFFVRPHP
ncbi:MAPEG family protein [Phenylobacterium montanum]|uniref:MAPEG family protein n=1 Tax=Phenylobacterium montanum TaxID=2823693 RepID=A0A975ITI5_9CAUL|nr:MAPEG family protein [Caulobacter sp. S6]QUD86823.1 MAPEG family protein [Caulobacter sp. S6]